MNIRKGFTLIEVLIVLAIILIISLIVIATINPVEQLNKAKDSANDANATNLLTAIERFQTSHDGQNPNIANIADSIDCTNIISSGFVYDLSDLSNELSDWFPKEITKPESELYAGFSTDRVRVCYQVKSVKSISQVSKYGCSVDSLFYLCLPR